MIIIICPHRQFFELVQKDDDENFYDENQIKYIINFSKVICHRQFFKLLQKYDDENKFLKKFLLKILLKYHPLKRMNHLNFNFYLNVNTIRELINVKTFFYKLS